VHCVGGDPVSIGDIDLADECGVRGVEFSFPNDGDRLPARLRLRPDLVIGHRPMEWFPNTFDLRTVFNSVFGGFP